jgi:hypothetical protein
VTAPLDVSALLRRLAAAQVDFVLIGGLAVNAHGVIRSTRDVDIVPSGDPQNLARLARLLADLEVRQLGVGNEGFADNEMPLDPTRAEDLRQGGNFRLETALGALDIMQWVPGIDADQAFATLAAEAQVAHAFDTKIRVCSLRHLRTMKETAGRPQDLQDLADLAAANGD